MKADNPTPQEQFERIKTQWIAYQETQPTFVALYNMWQEVFNSRLTVCNCTTGINKAINKLNQHFYGTNRTK